MNDQECNKIIAEYMYPDNNPVKLSTGESCFEHTLAPNYSNSVDSNLPVLEELRKHKYVFTLHVTCNPLGYFEASVTPSTEEGDNDRWDKCYCNSKDLKQAVAYAAAEAIKELGRD